MKFAGLLSAFLLVGACCALKKNPFPAKGSENDRALMPWLQYGCAEWEGNCGGKRFDNGTQCDKGTYKQICTTGYYHCHNEDCCIQESDRPATCPTSTQAPAEPEPEAPTSSAAPVPVVSTQAPPELTAASPTDGPEHDCPKNEYWTDCALCAEFDCKDVVAPPVQDRKLSANENCAQGRPGIDDCSKHRKGCYCAHGFNRNSKGKCVTDAECHYPDCGENAHFEPAPQCLDNRCEDIDVGAPAYDYESPVLSADQKALRNHPYRNYRLKKGCRCDEGYARNSIQQCVHVDPHHGCQEN